MIEVTLRVDPGDGNDPIDASLQLPAVPREGDLLQLWDIEGGHLNPPTGTRPHPNWSGEEVIAEVDYVVFTSYWPQVIEIWLKFDGFDLDQVIRVMTGVTQGHRP